MHKYELLKEKLQLIKNNLLKERFVIEEEKKDKTYEKLAILNDIHKSKNNSLQKQNKLNFIKNFKSNIKTKVIKYIKYGTLSFLIISVLTVLSKEYLLLGLGLRMSEIVSGLALFGVFITAFVFLVNNKRDIANYCIEYRNKGELETDLENINLELSNLRDSFNFTQNLESELSVRLNEIKKNIALCENYEKKIISKMEEINSNNVNAINEIYNVDKIVEETLMLVRRFDKINN